MTVQGSAQQFHTVKFKVKKLIAAKCSEGVAGQLFFVVVLVLYSDKYLCAYIDISIDWRVSDCDRVNSCGNSLVRLCVARGYN